MASSVQTRSDVDAFTLHDHPAQVFYEKFKEKFGSDEFFIIAFEDRDLFSAGGLDFLKRLTEELEALNGAREILSLANVNHIYGANYFFYVSDFLQEIPTAGQELEYLRRQALTNPLYVKNFISKDAGTAAILVFPDLDSPADLDRQELLQRLKAVLTPYQGEGREFYLAGWTVTQVAMDRYMQADLSTFIPVSYLVMALVLWFFFANITLTLLGLLNLSMALLATLGMFGLMDIPLNNVTSIVPPLVMALTLALTVHLFFSLQTGLIRSYSADTVEIVQEAAEKVFLPCLLSALTTALGFASLMISELQPIKEFALMAASGILCGFLFTFFFLPFVLCLLNKKRIKIKSRLEKALANLLQMIIRFCRLFSWKIVLTFFLLIVMSFFAAWKIRAETNFLEYFKDDSQIRQDALFVQNRLAGINTLDISLQAKERDAFKAPANLEILSNIQLSLEDLSGIDSTVSMVDMLREMNQAFHNGEEKFYRVPASRQLVAQYLLLYDADDIEDYVNREYDHARIALRTSLMGSFDQQQLVDRIRGILEDYERESHLNLKVTGRVIHDLTIVEALVKGQINSLVLAGGIMSLVLMIALRSLRFGLLSLIPNGFPILINFGIMGLAGIPLNTATALIAAVALGIAVDDTIHFLAAYFQARKKGSVTPEAVKEAIMDKGRPIITSSVILFLGFGVLALSNFVPTMYFGILCSTIIVAAVLGDLVLLPALLFFLSDRDSRLRLAGLLKKVPEIGK